VPIETLFAGGLAPGLLMVAMVSAWGVLQGVKCGAARQRFSPKEACAAVWAAKWELGMPVVVIAGLFGGIGTLVEAGAIAVAYAVIVECFILREFSLRRDFPRVAVECVTVVGGVLLIIGMAKGLTYFLAIQSVPEILTNWVNLHIHSRYVFLLLLNVVLLIKGSFMDVFSAIIVMVPLIQPIAARFGIDPVQMGVIFLANLELGYLTPPIGMNLCLSAYRFRKPMTTVYRATLPFYLILLVGVLLITYVPALTTLPVKWFGLIGDAHATRSDRFCWHGRGRTGRPESLERTFDRMSRGEICGHRYAPLATVNRDSAASVFFEPVCPLR
jgi:tripartite ATP-independent transporter DctM subunit